MHLIPAREGPGDGGALLPKKVSTRQPWPALALLQAPADLLSS